MGRTPAAAPALALALALALTLAPASLLAQDTPVQSTPTPGRDEPATQEFVSPLERPAASPTAAPTETPPETPTVTLSPSPTATAEPTATSTNTPTPTIAPLQVSPLIAQNSTRLPDDGSLLWIGGAALLVLVGSAVMLAAERRSSK